MQQTKTPETVRRLAVLGDQASSPLTDVVVAESDFASSQPVGFDSPVSPRSRFRRSERAALARVSLLCATAALGCGGSIVPGTSPRSPEQSVQDRCHEPVLAGSFDSEKWTEPSAAVPGWLGVDLVASPTGRAGVLVRDVVHGSPAAQAELRSGDVLLRVRGQSVSRPEDVVQLVSERGAGRRLNLVLLRGPEERLVAVLLASVPTSDELLNMSYVGTPAPPLEALTAARGRQPLTLGAVRGRVTVVEFWSSWCAVCRMLIPVMNDWHERYRTRGVKFLAITTEPASRAAQAAAGLGMDYPVASDESERTTLAYRALALPTVFVIDPEGTVRDVMVGFSRPKTRQLEALIKELAGNSRRSDSGSRPAGEELVSARSSPRQRRMTVR
jgi:thiol-disulfide isomerase/thioredoxin